VSRRHKTLVATTHKRKAAEALSLSLSLKKKKKKKKNKKKVKTNAFLFLSLFPSLTLPRHVICVFFSSYLSFIQFLFSFLSFLIIFQGYFFGYFPSSGFFFLASNEEFDSIDDWMLCSTLNRKLDVSLFRIPSSGEKNSFFVVL